MSIDYREIMNKGSDIIYKPFIDAVRCGIDFNKGCEGYIPWPSAKIKEAYNHKAMLNNDNLKLIYKKMSAECTQCGNTFTLHISDVKMMDAWKYMVLELIFNEKTYQLWEVGPNKKCWNFKNEVFIPIDKETNCIIIKKQTFKISLDELELFQKAMAENRKKVFNEAESVQIVNTRSNEPIETDKPALIKFFEWMGWKK